MSALQKTRPKRRGPRSCTAAELKRVGVTLEDPNGLWLRCDECGRAWSPDFPGGSRRFHRGYWKCPHNGCNAD